MRRHAAFEMRPLELIDGTDLPAAQLQSCEDAPLARSSQAVQPNSLP